MSNRIDNLFDQSQMPQGSPVDIGYMQATYGYSHAPTPVPPIVPVGVNPFQFRAGSANRLTAPVTPLLPFENPMMAMAGNMILPMITSALGLPPILAPIGGSQSVSGYDYYQGQLRQQAIMSIPNAALYGNPQTSAALSKLGQAGSNGFVQMGYDFIRPGGSAKTAASTLMTAMGPQMGESLTDQARMSGQVIMAMDSLAQSKDGTFDYAALGGLNRNDVAKALIQSSQRGYSASKMSDGDTSVTGIAQVLSGAAGMVRSGRNILGESASVEDVFSMVEKIIPDAQSMGTQKSAQILDRLKGMSKTLDIDAKAMVAYTEMMNKIYENAGISTKSGAAANFVIEGMMSAKAVSEVASARGLSSSFRDPDKVMQSAATMEVRAKTSPMAQATGAMFQAYAMSSIETRKKLDPLIKEYATADENRKVQLMKEMYTQGGDEFRNNATVSMTNPDKKMRDDAANQITGGKGGIDTAVHNAKGVTRKILHNALRDAGFSDQQIAERMKDNDFLAAIANNEMNKDPDKFNKTFNFTDQQRTKLNRAIPNQLTLNKLDPDALRMGIVSIMPETERKEAEIKKKADQSVINEKVFNSMLGGYPKSWQDRAKNALAYMVTNGGSVADALNKVGLGTSINVQEGLMTAWANSASGKATDKEKDMLKRYTDDVIDLENSRGTKEEAAKREAFNERWGKGAGQSKQIQDDIETYLKENNVSDENVKEKFKDPFIAGGMRDMLMKNYGMSEEAAQEKVDEVSGKEKEGPMDIIIGLIKDFMEMMERKEIAGKVEEAGKAGFEPSPGVPESGAAPQNTC